MTRKTEEQRNLEFAENRREKVAPSPLKKAMAIGAVALGTAAGVFGIGKSPEQNQPPEIGTDIGRTTGQEFALQKDGPGDEIGDALSFENPENQQQPFVTGNDGHKSAETERETSEQEQPFITGNDGHKAANIEREANNSGE